MLTSTNTTRFRFWLWLIRGIGVLVPRRLRADWRQEWEAELRYRETLLAEWDKLDWRSKFDLWRRSVGAFRDALWLQPQRLEDEMFQDLRYGLRLLLKAPLFTGLAVLTLALGIGANTLIFSVVNTVWLRPLPYPEPEQLMLVFHENIKQSGTFEITPAAYFDLRQQSKSFEHFAAYSSKDFNLTGLGEPERLRGQIVSAALFPLLKVPPSLGRALTEADDRDGALRVVVLSHTLWQRRFGADASIIGQTLNLDDQSYTVVGVMPPGFYFPNKETELWAPLALAPALANDRGAFFLYSIARVKPGATLSHAQSELNVIASNMMKAFPQTNTDLGFTIVSLHGSLVSDFKRALFVLLGAVVFVLLIACVNVANLLLARAMVREKELAVRAALGAGRQRLLRQLLTESTLLALAGGAVGLLLAVWGSRALKLINPGTIARLDEVSLDWRVLGFTLGVACLTGVIFGLVPALQFSKPDLQHMLKEGGRGLVNAHAQRLRGLLVVTEIALSLVLLVGAGLLIRSFIQLQRVDLGFNPEHLLTLQIELSDRKNQDLKQVRNFYQEVLERVQSLPGVEGAGITNATPIATPGMRSAVAIENKPDPPAGRFQIANVRVISPNYFRTLSVPLLKGRLLSAQDNPETPLVAVINQAMARRYWGEEDPVGKRFKFGLRASDGSSWLTVVGVVGNVRQEGLNTEPLPELYSSFTQEHARWARPRVLLIRTTGDPFSLVTAVKSQIWAVNKDQAIHSVQTMEEIVGDWLAPRRFNLWLLGVFATLALVLASVGIYGVISYTVTQRTREIGVRMALGAGQRDILKLVVGEGLGLTLGGITIGLVTAFALTRWLESLLFGVSVTDPLTFIGVSLLLTFVALLACYLPARRATKVNPLTALRHD